jgi:hypothetical protein
LFDGCSTTVSFTFRPKPFLVCVSLQQACRRRR